MFEHIIVILIVTNVCSIALLHHRRNMTMALQSRLDKVEHDNTLLNIKSDNYKDACMLLEDTVFELETEIEELEDRVTHMTIQQMK